MFVLFRIYEDNVIGKLSDERYSRMASEYETEQKELITKVAELKELTPTVVNKLIGRIEIHNNEKKHSHNNVKVDIYFTAIGLFDIPTEQQLLQAV